MSQEWMSTKLSPRERYPGLLLICCVCYLSDIQPIFENQKIRKQILFLTNFDFFLLRTADDRTRTWNLLAAGRLPWPFGYGVTAGDWASATDVDPRPLRNFPVKGRAKVGGGDWPMLQFSSLCQHAGEHVYKFPSSSSVTLLSKHFISAIYYRLSATRYKTTDIVALTLRIKFWFRAS